MIYQEPSMEILKFNMSDVVCTSQTYQDPENPNDFNDTSGLWPT